MDTLFDAKRKVERAIAHINGIEKWLWTLNEENREIARAYKQDAPERNLHTVWVKQFNGFSLPLGPMRGRCRAQSSRGARRDSVVDRSGRGRQ
jgi:hypothetical protein